jgi:large subunit ribosomal protein L17
MRHNKSFNHLGRTSAHRKAMLSNMACSLIMHKRIETTTAKAKALKKYIEPLITRSKEDSTHSRRMVFSYLQDKEAVTELFREVSIKVADRPGGYTRIIRLGNRLGDNADMCMMELVDYNELLLGDKSAAKKSSSRRRRGGAKKKSEETATAATAAIGTEEPEVEVEAVTDEIQTEESAEEVTATEEPVEEVTAQEVTATEEEPATEVKAEAVDEEPPAEEPPAAEEAKEEEASSDDDKKD